MDSILNIVYGIAGTCIIGILNIFFPNDLIVYSASLIVCVFIIIINKGNIAGGAAGGQGARLVSRIMMACIISLQVFLAFYFYPSSCTDLATTDDATRLKVECIDANKKIVRLSLFNQHGFRDDNIFANVGYVKKVGSQCMTIENVTNSSPWVNFIRGGSLDLPLGSVDTYNPSLWVFLSNKFVQGVHQVPNNSRFAIQLNEGVASCPN